MRIISGYHKGRRISAPKKLPVRPTTDMAKEALFNILNHRYYFDDITVLDLCAGIGSISFEFASRGTTKITAVDEHHGCTKFIDKTAKELDMPITVIKDDLLIFLKRTKERYSIIFADPPYSFSSEQLQEITELVFDGNLLEENGLLIIEHTKHIDLSSDEHFSEVKHYGGSVFSFFVG